jgi:hypothetical protein
MHGGAKGIGAPQGERNGCFRHGQATNENRAERRALGKLIREMRRQALDVLGRVGKADNPNI